MHASNVFPIVYIFCRRNRKVSKGFNFVSGKLLFGWADSRFGKPRTSRKGNGFILFACTKRTGSTPEVCEPLDSGDDSNLRSNSLRCNAGTSHRFKAFSPPFCAKNRFRLVLSGVFPRLFPAELWIEVAGQSPACFLVTFCTTQKVTSRFPYGKASRFSKPRFSSPQ